MPSTRRCAAPATDSVPDGTPPLTGDAAPRFSVIRDPLWQNIHVQPEALRIVDTPAFQRLRRVKQLGLAHLVYPGATHTRFDHALGVYHLARRALVILEAAGQLGDVPLRDRELIPIAGLLHDIGHYPFSHALEDLEVELVPEGHEEAAGRFLGDPDVRAALGAFGPDAGARLHALILGRSEHPLQGLVSGSLDLDKIEYLKRDAMFCGVPYGEVDVDRLLESLRVARHPASGRLELAVAEQGLAALESLLFAKYQMFRNVYWHHAVRAATVVFQRLVREALRDGWADLESLARMGDEDLLSWLEARAAADASASARRARERWIPALRNRRLPKRAAEWSGDELPHEVAAWVSDDPRLRAEVEDRLSTDLGLERGHLFLDYPAKPGMMALEISVVRKEGDVLHLTSTGRAGLIDLPRLGRDLYNSARVLRVLTISGVEVDRGALLKLLTWPH
ncbi:MAG: HD domain-containing protein, partial [Gemmatimonadota bacterium]